MFGHVSSANDVFNQTLVAEGSVRLGEPLNASIFCHPIGFVLVWKIACLQMLVNHSDEFFLLRQWQQLPDVPTLEFIKRVSGYSLTSVAKVNNSPVSV